MIRCEDFPCCGHESGCCPRYDESGRQLDMVCVCGARLPVDNPTSICNTCLRSGDDWGGDDSDYSETDGADYPDETPMFENYYGGE